jgi:hypothetical protein
MKAAGLNGVAIPEILFNYRVRTNSMIRGVNKDVRQAYHAQITQKHQKLFSRFKMDMDGLMNHQLPLSIDNSTLDDYPFQTIPVLGKVVRRAIHTIRATPRLKRLVLWLKR